jgi:hypothetical protein
MHGGCDLWRSVQMSKKDKDDSEKRILATGAKGDPMNPAVGAPLGSSVLSAPVVVEPEPETKAKEDRK